jgi:uncharacterized membrane protein YcfT
MNNARRFIFFFSPSSFSLYLASHGNLLAGDVYVTRSHLSYCALFSSAFAILQEYFFHSLNIFSVLEHKYSTRREK